MKKNRNLYEINMISILSIVLTIVIIGFFNNADALLNVKNQTTIKYQMLQKNL